MSVTTYAESLELKGSGATFPYPIYAHWFRDFSQKHPGIRIKYRDKGSGAGIRDFVHGDVDFAASDAPLTMEEIARVRRGVVLLPTTAGEVVLAYNLQGVDRLRLPRDAYPDIFLGKIRRWNDPRIAAANPGVELPDMPITVATRSDSSGTSFILTCHLSSISPEFERRIGQTRMPDWPDSPVFTKAPGNQGVAARVKQTPGAIGYVEYGFANLVELPAAQLQNRAGSFISPNPQSSAAALAGVEFPEGKLPVSGAPDLMARIRDPEADNAYPIVGFTWLLLYSGGEDAEQDDEKAAALHKLVSYMLSGEAQNQAAGLGYIPLPEKVREKARSAAGFIR